MGEFVLSSISIGKLAEAIEAGNTATTMGTLFLKAGVDAWEPEGSSNKLDWAVRLLKNLRSDNSEEARKGSLELARLMLVAGKAEGFSREAADWWPGLRDAIAADGWEFDEDDDRLVPAVPGIRATEEVSWIESELTGRNWTVAAHHYREAVDAFARGSWTAANGQLRTFFECLLSEAGGVAASTGSGKVQKAFEKLENAGKLVAGEAAFGKALWKLLHTNGSHPGLSDQDESRFRLLTLTGYARYLLQRV